MEPVGYLPFYFMKHLTFQISIFLLLLITFTSCEKEYPTNVDTVWTRGLISDQSPFEFLNKNIIISWNNGKVEGQENRITTFTDLGKRETEDIDLPLTFHKKENHTVILKSGIFILYIKHGKVLLEYRTIADIS